jgi:hypothetical protein
MNTIELNESELALVAGGFVVGEILDAIKGGALSANRRNSSPSNDPFMANWGFRGAQTGTPVTIEITTTGGGRVDLGEKKDVWPVFRNRPWGK